MPRSNTPADTKSGRPSRKPRPVTAGLQPGLARRLDALLAPYADDPLQSTALEDLLTHLALWGEETTPQGDDVVTLSAYHSAKGLEFDRVVCMDVHDNAFPPTLPATRTSGARVVASSTWA